jgi:hypothetical protein
MIFTCLWLYAKFKGENDWVNQCRNWLPSMLIERKEIQGRYQKTNENGSKDHILSDE